MSEPHEPHPFHMNSYVGAEPRCWCDRYASHPIHAAPDPQRACPEPTAAIRAEIEQIIARGLASLCGEYTDTAVPQEYFDDLRPTFDAVMAVVQRDRYRELLDKQTARLDFTANKGMDTAEALRARLAAVEAERDNALAYSERDTQTAVEASSRAHLAEARLAEVEAERDALRAERERSNATHLQVAASLRARLAAVEALCDRAAEPGKCADCGERDDWHRYGCRHYGVFPQRSGSEARPATPTELHDPVGVEVPAAPTRRCGPWVEGSPGVWTCQCGDISLDFEDSGEGDRPLVDHIAIFDGCSDDCAHPIHGEHPESYL
jgi:hypothetical protein